MWLAFPWAKLVYYTTVPITYYVCVCVCMCVCMCFDFLSSYLLGIIVIVYLSSQIVLNVFCFDEGIVGASIAECNPW